MYALVPMIRAGRPIRPGGLPAFRPFGFDRSAHNFVACRLRDGRRRAIVWYDDPVIDAQVSKIADDKTETLALASRTALGTVVSDRAIAAGSKLDATIVNLLKAPPSDWFNQPLRPGHDGFSIWLGPGGRGNNRFYFEPVARVRHSKRWIDNFNRANGDLAGSTLSGGGTTWIEPFGTDWQVVSNQASATTVVEAGNLALTNTDADTDSEFAEGQMAGLDFSGTEHNATIAACYGSDGLSGYYLAFGGSITSQSRFLGAAGAESILDSDSTSTTSGLMKIIRDGTSVEGFLNGASILGPVTDSGEASGVGKRRVGFSTYSSVVGSRTVTFDNFDGGDYPVGRRFILH